MRNSRTWKDNAAEFAALDRGEGWPFARLVACSVEKGPRGGDTTIRRSSDGKVSAGEFAGVAGTSDHRVLRYLNAWQDAANRGWVTDANLLTPGDAHEISDPDQPWRAKDGGVYDASKTGGQISDVAQIAAKASRDKDYARRVVTEVTNASAEAEVAVRQVLDKRYADSPKLVSKPQPNGIDDGIDLVHEFVRLHEGVDRIVQLVNEGRAIVTEGTRDAILREVKWLRVALGYIEDGVSSDSLATEIADFLGAQS